MIGGAVLIVVVLLGLITIASAAVVARWPVRWAQIVIWTLVLQNVVVIAIWKMTGSDDLARNLLYAKEVIIAGGSVVAIFAAIREARAGRLPLVMWLVVAFGVLCAIWIPISHFKHEGLEQIARGLRSLAYPVLLLAIGILLVRGMGAALTLRRTLWMTAILLGVTAVIERSLIPLHFWVSIGLSNYWVGVRGESAAMLNGGLPWNFYVPLLGSVVRRAFGIMTDPLGLSYYLLLPLALASAEIWRSRFNDGRWPWLAVAAALASALGVVFSLSRVPIAIAALVVVIGPVVGSGFSADRRWQLTRRAVLSGAVFGILLLISAVSSPKVGPADLAAQAPIDLGSEGSHQASLLRAGDIRPLIIGEGLGTAGYLSSKYAASGATIGYENPYLDAAAQVGILGGLLLAAIVAVATLQLLLVRGPTAVIAIPTGATLGSLAVGGFLSGQLEVITSLGVTWLFVGVVLSTVTSVRATSASWVSAPGDAARRPDAVTSAQSRP
jgi:hypothetical protein